MPMLIYSVKIKSLVVVIYQYGYEHLIKYYLL